MLGETSVDVNALCLDRSQTYVLMIEQRQTASCTVINSAIARCHLPKVYDWGTKTVYFQPQSGSHQEDKAFVGYIYFGQLSMKSLRFKNVMNEHNDTLEIHIMFNFFICL